MAPSGNGSRKPAANEVTERVVLTLRNQVIFPSVSGIVELPLEEFEEVYKYIERTGVAEVGTLAHRAPKKNQPSELYEVGTLCRLVSHSKNADKGGTQGNGDSPTTLMVQGYARFRVVSFKEKKPLRVAALQILEEPATEDDVTVRALVYSIREVLMELLKSEGKKNPHLPSAPAALAAHVGTMLPHVSIEEKQLMLEADSMKSRLEMALELAQRETEAKRIVGEISTNIQRSREVELRGVVMQRQIQEVQKDLQRLRDRMQQQQQQDGSEGETSGEGGGEFEDGDDEAEDEVAILAEKLGKAGLPEEAVKIAKRELRRLKSLQPQHPEYTSIHTYLELLASLPWTQSSEDQFDLRSAKAILDGDHKGLHKVKRRLLEFLAVQKMRGDMKGPILCLHGPPGIGKTSLGRSVAKALGRKFYRIALGGVRDEAEIRGHRRTYIGSMSGSIIQAFQTLGVNNPVILLDEVDKMTQNSMFNPQATLLEVLDPEQNNSFKDHYVNTPFDLSRALFICTANDSSLIDRPLLDRMEVIELSGYTLQEKLSIAETHLLPKQRRLHGLESEEQQPASASSKPATSDVHSDPRLVVTSEALRGLISKWTAESGVRSLERYLAQICRWTSLRLQGLDVPNKTASHEREEALKSCGPDSNRVVTVEAKHLPYIVGTELFEPDIAEHLIVGVAMGLSVSAVGGNLLFIEATKTRGSGKLTVTGQLGSVMNESVETALSLLRSRFVRKAQGGVSRRSAGTAAGAEDEQPAVATGVMLDQLYAERRRSTGDDSVATDPFKDENVHVHFPAGGIPKDGPSAGVAVFLALASMLLDRPMRSDTAVTGEVSLRGHILPVGGIRDKVLAAQRAGVKHVLLPYANKRHVLEDIPARTLESIEVHYIKHVDEALDWAFSQHRGVSAEETEALARQEDSSRLPAAAVAAAAAAAARGALPQSRL